MLWYTFSVVYINRISCQISHLISQQLGKCYAPGFEPKSCQTHSPWLHLQISNICTADHDRAQRGVMSGEAKIIAVPKLIIYSHRLIIDFKGLWSLRNLCKWHCKATFDLRKHMWELHRCCSALWDTSEPSWELLYSKLSLSVWRLPG